MPSPTDAGELQALFDGVEAARKEATTIWGAERLPMIVGDDWRVALRQQQAMFSEAHRIAWETERLTADQIQAVRDRAAGLIRGWNKLSAVAAEQGHRPLSPTILAEWLLPSGQVAVLVRTTDEATQLVADGRNRSVYTLDEIGYLIGSFVPESLALAKVHFPGATFKASSTLETSSEWLKDGDPIPF
ncbi:hypothetical protein [Phenylobacterium immobile]|uniref:hypothetical protein n=1 Tax=Phenylobacterium immobile TaxID=21 RepID=UPI000AD91528|nr:hypothetical protein [Phenylobacterium immobile]